MARYESKFPDLIRGDTYRFALRFTEDGAPIDIAGYQLTLTIKNNLDDEDSEAVLQHTVAVPAGAEAALGEAEFVLSSAQTQLPPGDYWMDFERRIPGTPDDVRTLRVQRVKVLADATHGNP